jgi:hypothetical protein
MFYDKHHDPAIQDLYFRLLSDPEYFCKWRYTDNIDAYNSLIRDCEKQLTETSLTDYHSREKLVYTLQEAKKDLAKVRAEYTAFRKYQKRTATRNRLDCRYKYYSRVASY